MVLVSSNALGLSLTEPSPYPSPVTASPPPIIERGIVTSPAPLHPIDPLCTSIHGTPRPGSSLALPFDSVFNWEPLTTDHDHEPVQTKSFASSLSLALRILISAHIPPKVSRDENPHRPALRGSRSKFDLEPNPFEQSFVTHRSSSSSDKTPPRGTEATSIKHNTLPPLSSLTSPAAADPAQFPWLAGHSLRTGPLSPAMLAGPAQTGNGHHHASHNPSNLRAGITAEQTGNGGAEGGFDTSSFRTGFTPGAGTGFTPGYNALMNGNSFALPMPSPNTTAFLNMVTNSTPGADGGETPLQPFPGPDTSQPPSAIPGHMQHHALSHINAPHDVPQDTITPNTLSALTGVFNNMAGPANGQPGSQQYYPQGIQRGQLPPPGMPQNMPPQADFAQQSANAASQAANGLFLLSQAHHELSKREEQEGKGATKAAPRASGGGQKRKSDVSTGGQAKQLPPAKKGKKNSMGGASTPPLSAAKSIKQQMEESVSPSFSMEGDDDDDGEERRGSGPGGRETEEEKRKNFLERNRQGGSLCSHRWHPSAYAMLAAALKCRQRKKAWLNELQTKVEGLTMENEGLQRTLQSLHEEVGRLSNLLMQHRDCGLVATAQVGYGRR
ncbi:ATF/CREB family transcription factor, partial [Tremellales sp. Uapishka_1]